ncbi:formate dehydrogenase subunit gamma [Alkalilimnicola ehrlichii MLHE-1]|uniref:Formate dehydrogenase gamma subunit n=1 Tax=Alkalilimnicola ehrlichii (strain ATCC BAA-1101 / DSM 17681 / MLHE-1) TaxID=187272 RepID=Q0A5X2_ALKEH|nr:formate dehydrogenase subunit gamma [Alkalilimnicola ehrlichii]ABI57765.1 formate dehydrogenase gamma subunit [Alkalilimnicola ehrlichii MLHE-1]
MSSDSTVIPRDTNSGWAAERARRGGRQRHSKWWLLAVIVSVTLSLPLSGYLAPAAASQGADLAGFYPESQISYSWSSLREGPLTIFALLAIAGSILVFLAFHLFAGKVRIDGGRSGTTVPRWSRFERLLHWLLAGSFIVLAITGLSLFFGRYALMPLLGERGFSTYASGAIWIHETIGLVFVALLVAAILQWIKGNLFRSYDWQWFKQGGGYIGDRNTHPPAGKANGGEKLYFWLGIVSMGSVTAITGLVLYFTTWTGSEGLVAWSLIFHVLGAAGFIALAIGHVYLGAIGNEGTLEGMVSGRVDCNWAKQHHNIWYEEILQDGVQPEPASTSAADASVPSAKSSKSTATDAASLTIRTDDAPARRPLS